MADLQRNKVLRSSSDREPHHRETPIETDARRFPARKKTVKRDKPKRQGGQRTHSHLPWESGYDGPGH